MSSRVRRLVFIAVTMLAPLSLSAQVVVDGSAAAPAPVAPATRSPLMQDITAAWESHLVVVAALEQQLAGAASAADALALQHQIEAVRAQVEIQILTLQARYARQEGRLDDAAGIEAAIAELTTPRPRGTPVERPREAD
jgi:hypothetical protein